MTPSPAPEINGPPEQMNISEGQKKPSLRQRFFGIRDNTQEFLKSLRTRIEGISPEDIPEADQVTDDLEDAAQTAADQLKIELTQNQSTLDGLIADITDLPENSQREADIRFLRETADMARFSNKLGQRWESTICLPLLEEATKNPQARTKLGKTWNLPDSYEIAGFVSTDTPDVKSEIAREEGKTPDAIIIARDTADPAGLRIFACDFKVNLGMAAYRQVAPKTVLEMMQHSPSARNMLQEKIKELGMDIAVADATALHTDQGSFSDLRLNSALEGKITIHTGKFISPYSFDNVRYFARQAAASGDKQAHRRGIHPDNVNLVDVNGEEIYDLFDHRTLGEHGIKMMKEPDEFDRLLQGSRYIRDRALGLGIDFEKLPFQLRQFEINLNIERARAGYNHLKAKLIKPDIFGRTTTQHDAEQRINPGGGEISMINRLRKMKSEAETGRKEHDRISSLLSATSPSQEEVSSAITGAYYLKVVDKTSIREGIISASAAKNGVSVATIRAELEEKYRQFVTRRMVRMPKSSTLDEEKMEQFRQEFAKKIPYHLPLPGELMRQNGEPPPTYTPQQSGDVLTTGHYIAIENENSQLLALTDASKYFDLAEDVGPQYDTAKIMDDIRSKVAARGVSNEFSVKDIYMAREEAEKLKFLEVEDLRYLTGKDYTEYQISEESDM